MALKDKGGFLVDDSVWLKMKKNLQKGQHLATKVGFFDKYYGPENDNLSVAQVASWNEEGHNNGGLFPGSVTPPRPFLRMYIFKLEQDGKLVQEMAHKIHLVAIGKMTWTTFYNDLGEEAKNDVKEVIKAWDYPPNGPKTIELKGFNNPLQESDVMLESIEYKIGRK
ncbi:hypothetical protein D3C85_494540 [compost metagenome]